MPFYKILTPVFRNYISEQTQVETYLPMQQVPCENPLTQLDFMFVITGCLEFVLEDAIQRQLRDDQRNVFRLRARQHIDSQDIITELEQIPTSEAE